MMNPTILLAKTTAEDVFKSVGDSLDTRVNPNHLILIVVGLIMIVVVISLLNRRAAPRADGKPKPLNNPTKLTRQIARQMGLSRRDMKRLNELATQMGVENPLALLLCPSVLKQAATKRP
jgi:hypothetical protein